MATANELIDKLEGRLDEQIASAKKSRTVTIVIVGILMIALCIYLTVLTNQIQSLLQPQDVSMMVTDQIRTKIPAVRRMVAAEIKQQAPAALDKAVEDFLAQVPQARKDVVLLVDKLVEEQVRAINRDVDKGFDEALAKHGPEIRGLIKELNTPDGPKRFEDFVYDTLSEQLKHPELKHDIEGYGLILVRMSNRLSALFAATELSTAQRLEKEFIQTLREISNRTPKYEPTPDAKLVSDEIKKDVAPAK